VAINPQKCHRAWHERELLDVLNRADVVGICDGVGVSVASRLLNGQNLKRVTGCDLFFRLVSLAAQKGWRVFALGASEESNSLACSRLCQKYPGLQIVGRQNGFFEDAGCVIEHINASKADLLFVAMGSPRQEYWIARHRAEINAAFCMGVGGSFDVAAGTVKRAPAIFRKVGAEWLYQLVTEPHKRFKRQTVYVPFMLRMIGINVFGDVMDTEQAKKPVLHPLEKSTARIQ
jgi:N-acetylglucosaminyldiphosphoundecaprenol N-acetyl-beta-D-mannosaminyltransferase